MVTALLWAVLLGGLSVLAYTYIGHPLVLAAITRGTTAPATRRFGAGDLPSVTVVVPVHNEAAVVERKVENLRALEYDGPLTCLFVSDSTDDTDACLDAAMAPWMDRLTLDERRGKSYAINRALERVSSDVVVFSDANTMYEPDAVTELVAPLSDPEVGCVTGRLRLTDSGEATTESTYWRYELRLRALEARLGATVSVNGGLLSARRADLSPLPAGALTDDLVVALRQLRAGRRVVYSTDAVGWEATTGRVEDEFARRVRIGAGNYQTLVWFADLLAPTRGRVAVTFFSHKVLRWLAPWVLLAVLATNVALFVTVGGPIVTGLLALQTLGYTLGLLGLTSTGARRWRVVRVPMYFLLMNAALAAGCLQFVRGPSTSIWTDTPRE